MGQDNPRVNAKQLVAELEKLSPDDIYDRRELVLAELSIIEEEVSKRSQQKRRHVPATEPAWRTDPGSGVKMWTVIAPEIGFDIHNFFVFMLEIPPHYESGTYHVHGDAVKHYLSGHGEEIIGDDRFKVGPGDFLHVPAGVWHGTQNPGDEPIRILGIEIRPGAPLQVPVSHIGKGWVKED